VDRCFVKAFFDVKSRILHDWERYIEDDKDIVLPRLQKKQ